MNIAESIAIGALLIALVRAELSVRRMKIDPTYGIWTRQAVEASPPKSGGIVFWDIDHMHEANEELGYAEVDKRISRAARLVRISRGCKLIARWYSGDEFIYSCPENQALGAANRIQSLFLDEGLSVTIGVSTICGDWRNAVRDASALVQDAKRRGERGQIFVCKPQTLGALT